MRLRCWFIRKKVRLGRFVPGVSGSGLLVSGAVCVFDAIRRGSGFAPWTGEFR